MSPDTQPETPAKRKMNFRFDPAPGNWFHCSRCDARIKGVHNLAGHAAKHINGTIPPRKRK